MVYAGSALTLSRRGTLSIAHLFKAIGYLRVGMYACAAREFEYAPAAAEKEGREDPRDTLPFWDDIQMVNSDISAGQLARTFSLNINSPSGPLCRRH